MNLRCPLLSVQAPVAILGSPPKDHLAKSSQRRPFGGRLLATRQRQMPPIQRLCGERLFSHRRRNNQLWTPVRVSERVRPGAVVDQQVLDQCFQIGHFTIVFLLPRLQSLPLADASLRNNHHPCRIYPIPSWPRQRLSTRLNLPLPFL